MSHSSQYMVLHCRWVILGSKLVDQVTSLPIVLIAFVQIFLQFAECTDPQAFGMPQPFCAWGLRPFLRSPLALLGTPSHSMQVTLAEVTLHLCIFF